MQEKPLDIFANPRHLITVEAIVWHEFLKVKNIVTIQRSFASNRRVNVETKLKAHKIF
jgi:hypothetical protein